MVCVMGVISVEKKQKVQLTAVPPLLLQDVRHHSCRRCRGLFPLEHQHASEQGLF